MAKRHDKQVSAGRRGFFRQILASAIEGAEQVGKEMARRAGYTPPPPRYEPPKYDPYQYGQWYGQNYDVHGPPWPPPLGPPIPQHLRAELRKLDPHHACADETVARGDDWSDGPAEEQAPAPTPAPEA